MKGLGFLLLAAVLILGGCGSGGGGSDAVFDGGEEEIIDDVIVPPTPSTTLNDIGSFDSVPGEGWNQSHAAAINDDGMVVGNSMSHAIYWDSKTPSAQMLRIGNHADETGIQYGEDDLDWGWAVKISPSGVIIGYSTPTDDASGEKKRGFVYDVNNPGFLDIDPETEGAFFSHPVDISNTDLIAITAEANLGDPADKNKHAFILDYRNDGLFMVTLEDASAKSSQAVAVNDNYWLTYTSGGMGYYYSPMTNIAGPLGSLNGNALIPVDINNSITPDVDGSPRPHIVGNAGDIGFFWEAGVAVPINIVGQGKFEVVAMNDLDQVIVKNGDKAYLWELVNGRGVFTEIGSLGGGTTVPVAINNKGQVVGYSTTGASYVKDGLNYPIYHGFLWTKQPRQMLDLGTHEYFYPYLIDPAYPVSEATGLNNNGDVTGYSQALTGHVRGFTRIAP